VDLDSLLDFRLATVSRLDDAFASTLLTEAYIDRDRDDLFFQTHGGIDPATFNEAYRQRNAEYLMGAKPTGVYWLLGKIISEFMIAGDSPHAFREVELVINVWPFVLSDEAVYVLENAVSIYLDAKLHIRSINQNPVDISPNEMKVRYNAVVMYDFNYWSQAHHHSLTTTYMHPLAIYTPSLKRGHVLEQERVAELQNEFKDNINPFEWTTQWLMDVVSLRYVDTRHFSVELFKFPVGAA
jgi:hypothetical protein